MEEIIFDRTKGIKDYYALRREILNAKGYRDLRQVEQETSAQGESPIKLTHLLGPYTDLVLRRGLVTRVSGRESFVIQSIHSGKLWLCTISDIQKSIPGKYFAWAKGKNYIIHEEFIKFLNSYRHDEDLPEGLVPINDFITSYCLERGIKIPKATIQSARNQGNINVLYQGYREKNYGKKEDLIIYAENYIRKVLEEA